MQPIRWEGDLAIFTTAQIEYLGIPDERDYPRYLVIEGSPIYVQSYSEIAQSVIKTKHRYNRYVRFRSTLYFLLGSTDNKFLNHLGPQPKSSPLVVVLSAYVNDESPSKFEDTRSILIHYGAKNLVKYIPALLNLAGKTPLLKFENMSKIIQDTLADFKRLEEKFFRDVEIKKDRAYFPNLRFTALKILEKRGVDISQYPLLRTRRKLVALNNLFSQLY